eukprot:m.9088 g.9088  ORF g.9088 m.9088 type:complete len:243 (+) comp6841_c0_seq2:341-1069(+)
MAMPASYQKMFYDGLEKARLAVAMDNAGNYQSARVHYFAAANALNDISRIEFVPQKKEMFRQKATEYVRRIEELNEILNITCPSMDNVPIGASPSKSPREVQADKAYNSAKIAHEDRELRNAMKEYQRAMFIYVDASQNADPEAQARIATKWAECNTAGERLAAGLGLSHTYNAGPRPAMSPLHTYHDGENGGDNHGGGGGGGLPEIPMGIPSFDSTATPSAPPPADDSLEALQARLRKLKH